MKKLRLLLLTQIFLELAIGQNNNYPLSGTVSIYDYSPMIIMQRNTNIGGFIQGIQTRLQDGTNNWYFGSADASSWIISKGDWQGIKMLVSENGNVGIGTNLPYARLHIKDPSLITNFNGDQISTLRIETEHSIDHFSLLGFGGWSAAYPRNLAQIGARLTHSGSYLYFGTSDNYATGITNSAMIIDYNGNIGLGTTTPSTKLDVNGTVRANEVIVNTNGADFVFESDYKLPQLSDIEKFIKENKHLPDIKSASEMQKDGMNMSEMQTKLLQKIEELTLYIIQQNQKILIQEKANNQLKNDLNELREQINKLNR